MIKIKLLLTACILSGFCLVKAQLPSSDQIQTKKGPLTIKVIQHASMILTWNKKTICIDPSGEAKNYAGVSPNLVLVTDIHGDHFDPKILSMLNQEKTIFVVPKAVADLFPADIPKTKIRVLKNGEDMTISDVLAEDMVSDITIKSIPMYNLPETPDSKHPRGRGNGYVITFGDKNIYISGDTEDTEEMRGLKNIDAAFVCMNMPYTMDIKQASDAVLAFKPKIVYPYHYRGQNGKEDVQAFKKLVNDKDKNIEVRLLEWYPGQ